MQRMETINTCMATATLRYVTAKISYPQIILSAAEFDPTV